MDGNSFFAIFRTFAMDTTLLRLIFGALMERPPTERPSDILTRTERPLDA